MTRNYAGPVWFLVATQFQIMLIPLTGEGPGDPSTVG